MVKVELHGRLGRQFGRNWNLLAKTPAEALHAIDVNTKGKFLEYIQNSLDKNIGYKFAIDDHFIEKVGDVRLLRYPIGKNEVFHVFPTVGGSDPVSLLISLAVSLITSVVSMLLAPTPQIDVGTTSDTTRKDSYLFSGGPQPARQGNPVPLGYGEMMIYPIVIGAQFNYKRQGEKSSVSVFNEDYDAIDANDPENPYYGVWYRKGDNDGYY